MQQQCTDFIEIMGQLDQPEIMQIHKKSHDVLVEFTKKDLQTMEQ